MDCLGTVVSTVFAKCPQTKHPRLLILLVPSIEGLLSLRLVLEDTQQVAVAKGINGFGLVELLSLMTCKPFKCLL